MDQSVNRSQLQLIIAGLTDGVILIEPDQSIGWANDAALAMHGIEKVGSLGRTVAEYRTNFQLQYRNNHHIEEWRYPIERVVGGERFDEVVVEVTPAGKNKPQWVHRIRSLVINDTDGKPDCLVLILKDATIVFKQRSVLKRLLRRTPRQRSFAG